MNNLKKYNLYVLFSTFGRLLIEAFIPLLIYKVNNSIADVIYMYFIKYVFIILLVPLIKVLIKNFNLNHILAFGNITFVLLSYLTIHYKSVYVYALVYGFFLMIYWSVRHIYGIRIIEDKKTTERVSGYVIFTLLGSLFASYIGSIVLEKIGHIALCIFILLVMLLSLVFLYKIKIKAKKIDKIEVLPIIKDFPKKNYIILFLEQIKILATTIFPLYIYLNVAKSLKYIGIANFFTCLASIICILFLSKKMDKNKKDYMSVMCILLAISWILKVNVRGRTIFLFIVFLDGLFKSGLDTVLMRNTYSVGRDYKLESYSIFIELIKNIFRAFIFGIVLFLNFSLETIIYIGVVSLFINSFIKFDDGKKGYSSVK